MLAVTFQITSITSIRSITPLEIEVPNEIVNILNNFQNTCSMSVIHDYVLDFADSSEPHGLQIEYIIAAEKDEDDFKSEECIVDDEDEKVDFNYKRKAVKFWKNGKKVCRSLNSVQACFHKVKFLQQLYREESVEKSGTNVNKFAFITEYVLQKFREVYDKKSIMHDMNLRLDLENKGLSESTRIQSK